MSPVFYTFNDREKGIRHHRSDLRRAHASELVSHRRGRAGSARRVGTECSAISDYLPPRLDEYDRTVMRTGFSRRAQKVSAAARVKEAIEWGMTGPNLRACGFEWDFRKKQPYACYDQLEFDIPIGNSGDCYDRAVVHVEEMRQSLRIIRAVRRQNAGRPLQCGPSADDAAAKARTMHDIETLITHFLGVSWGPVIPPGEALGAIEATKGNNGYYLISDGGTDSYRTESARHRFAHMQMLPLLCRG